MAYFGCRPKAGPRDCWGFPGNAASTPSGPSRQFKLPAFGCARSIASKALASPLYAPRRPSMAGEVPGKPQQSPGPHLSANATRRGTPESATAVNYRPSQFRDNVNGTSADGPQPQRPVEFSFTSQASPFLTLRSVCCRVSQQRSARVDVVCGCENPGWTVAGHGRPATSVHGRINSVSSQGSHTRKPLSLNEEEAPLDRSQR